MVKTAIQIALIALGSCILVVFLSVIFGTRNMPMVASDTKSDVLAGFDLLVYLVGNPSFALGVLAPIALPMFAAAAFSSFASVAIVSRRK